MNHSIAFFEGISWVVLTLIGLVFLGVLYALKCLIVLLKCLVEREPKKKIVRTVLSS